MYGTHWGRMTVVIGSQCLELSERTLLGTHQEKLRSYRVEYILLRDLET